MLQPRNAPCIQSGLLLLAVVFTCVASNSSPIVSTTRSPLPTSLGKVISDVASTESFNTVCLVTSRSVTYAQRRLVLQQLFDSHNNDESADKEDNMDWSEATTAIASASGLVLAIPATASCHDAATTAQACGGNVLYYAAPIDWQHGEGVLDVLAPVMETILKQKQQAQQQQHLYILVPPGSDIEMYRRRMEELAEPVLGNLVSTTTSTTLTLQDIFDRVEYIIPSQAMATLQEQLPKRSADAVLTSSRGFLVGRPHVVDMTSVNLAAARTLGPVARRLLQEGLQKVESACIDPNTGTSKLVHAFGELCDATLRQTLVQFDETSPVLNGSTTAQQIRTKLKFDLDCALHVTFRQQLELLEQSHFEDFKRALSKLILSPNLQNDMQAAASTSVQAFRKSLSKLVPKASSSFWNVAAPQHAYARRLNDYVANRMLTARASGKFRPLPRKGVTVGLHWLLPKPFGNDFRQEPWMVHAADNMVYVPPYTKLTDVNPDDVAAGDWRDKIVPSPAGNDMLYMQ